ncbi:hypothetical protein [Spongiactinospora sp. TRM90649]|uniref:hypothetical protein n=1 Tax=Spongiactinospora sp. TRM90649 TaxID=3031114 RepID=UPI0023F9761C|nr:hypothetical protein [Spongiactinospora sp. TRM90649]MDF5758650.1 hypothetical protein [Spongiactinospora sp. TRM90649]
MSGQQHYDPYQLIREVGFMLSHNGLEVNELPEGKLGEALAGAGQLLRAYGITPSMDVRDTFDRRLPPSW